MVLVVVELELRAQGAALLLPGVAVDVVTLVGAAHLELVDRSHAGATSVRRSKNREGGRGFDTLGGGCSFTRPMARLTPQLMHA